jgi:putative flavoprotein involved in K+ transport
LVDANAKVGDVWRNRYDSLTLFTASQYSALPGFPIPVPKDIYLTKDQIANYLEAYASWFHFDIKLNTTVNRVKKVGEIFELDAGTEIISAKAVVVATSALQKAYVPSFAKELNPAIRQIHSAVYRRPGQLLPGNVLIVGAGNSGAQIAEELCHSHETSLSYENLPKLIPQRFLGKDIFWWLINSGQLNGKPHSGASQPIDLNGPGENLKRIRRAFPLIGSTIPKLLKSGLVKRFPRATGARNGKVVFSDSSEFLPDNIVWGTGFSHDFDWIEVPTFDRVGYPLHTRGISIVPGLYFIGLPNLYKRTSTTIGFVGPDAEYLAAHIAAYSAQSERRFHTIVNAR